MFILLLLLSLIIILLDSSIMFTISAGSNPGSGALMGSHGLHSIDRTFRRMWLDPSIVSRGEMVMKAGKLQRTGLLF